MRIKPYRETHIEGVISIENNPFVKKNFVKGDFGFQVSEDGRVWICINGSAFIRFVPSKKTIKKEG